MPVNVAPTLISVMMSTTFGWPCRSGTREVTSGGTSSVTNTRNDPVRVDELLTRSILLGLSELVA
jgi:hypothetical protein